MISSFKRSYVIPFRQGHGGLSAITGNDTGSHLFLLRYYFGKKVLMICYKVTYYSFFRPGKSIAGKFPHEQGEGRVGTQVLAEFSLPHQKGVRGLGERRSALESLVRRDQSYPHKLYRVLLPLG